MNIVRASAVLAVIAVTAGTPAWGACPAGMQIGFSRPISDVDFSIRMKVGKKGSMPGTSCCDAMSVSFTSETTFVLSHRGYAIAEGKARCRGSKVKLRPKAASRALLGWWVENELEAFWRVFDEAVTFRIDRATGVKLIVSMPEGQASDLVLSVGFAGSLVALSRPDRLGVGTIEPGYVKGNVKFLSQGDSPDPIEYEPSPYPQVKACDSESEPPSPGYPDYCR